MKHLLLSVLCAATLGAAAENTVTNTTTSTGYETLAAAFAAANDGETLRLDADQTITKRIDNSDKTVTINGNGRTINCKSIAFLAAGTATGTVTDPHGTINVQNATFDGTERAVTGQVLEVSQNGAMTLTNCTFRNFHPTTAWLTIVKMRGTLTMDGVRFADCSTPDDKPGFVFCGRSDGLVLKGNNDLSVYLEKTLRFKVEGTLTNTRPIDIYLEKGLDARNSSTTNLIVNGTRDTAPFYLRAQSGAALKPHDTASKANVLIAGTTTGTVTIGSEGYATYYTTDSYRLPDGLTAYAVVATANGIKTEKAYDAADIVPAATPLLLKGDAAEYTYNAELVAGLGTAPADNILHGQATEGNTPAIAGASKYYKFADGDQGLGFYYGAADGSAFNLAAGKAYLAIADAAAARFMPLEGVTAIATLNAPATTAPRNIKRLVDGQILIGRYNAAAQAVK